MLKSDRAINIWTPIIYLIWQDEWQQARGRPRGRLSAAWWGRGSHRAALPAPPCPLLIHPTVCPVTIRPTDLILSTLTSASWCARSPAPPGPLPVCPTACLVTIWHTDLISSPAMIICCLARWRKQQRQRTSEQSWRTLRPTSLQCSCQLRTCTTGPNSPRHSLGSWVQIQVLQAQKRLTNPLGPGSKYGCYRYKYASPFPGALGPNMGATNPNKVKI